MGSSLVGSLFVSPSKEGAGAAGEAGIRIGLGLAGEIYSSNRTYCPSNDPNPGLNGGWDGDDARPALALPHHTKHPYTVLGRVCPCVGKG